MKGKKMELSRRGFLGAMLAAAAAPAFVKASSLMPIYVPKQEVLTLWGDGVHDDSAALQALIDGKEVVRHDGVKWERAPDGWLYFRDQSFKLSKTVNLSPDSNVSFERIYFTPTDQLKDTFRFNSA
jgi:hypothetical protein